MNQSLSLFAEPDAAYRPVGSGLPTDANADGWSTAKLVCTDGRVNIFPHCYIAARRRRGKHYPGYWLQVGAPHAVDNVTHWREYPAAPSPALVLPLIAAADAS